MSRKEKNTTCSCGGSYDEKGVCSSCGKKRLKSKGWRVGQGMLSVLGTLVVLTMFTNTACLRDNISSNCLTDGLRASRLSDAAALPFTPTAAELIRRGFVDDENILDSDIAQAIDGMDVPGFLAGKLDDHCKMLSGATDTPVQIEPEEVTALLEDNRDALLESCMLRIEDSDVEALHKGVQVPLTMLNTWNKIFGGNAAGRAINRFFVSGWGILAEILLAGAVLWNWMRNRVAAGADRAGALKGMGRTVLIPAAIATVFCLVLGISALFTADGVVGLTPLIKAAALPVGLTCAMEAAAGLLMLTGGKYWAARIAYNEAHPEEAASPTPIPAPKPVSKTAPTAEIPAVKPAAPAAPAEEGKACITCGKALKSNARFCIYCGTNQLTGGNVADEILSAPEIRLPDVPEALTEAPEALTEVPEAITEPPEQMQL